MRNVFDQYEQPENRLTHALFTTLSQERSYLRPFLRHLGVSDVPPVKNLRLTEQQVPGLVEGDADEGAPQGLPDACIYTDDGWAVLFECKVQAHVSAKQLSRHRKTMVRHGFESPYVVVIAVDEAVGPVRDGTIAITWRDVYRWFNKRAQKSFWARELVQYMQTFERKMLAKDYEIRGTITVFDGLRFDRDNPYTYREGKRLIRLLGDQMQARKDLHKIGVDPKGQRRPAITGTRLGFVWDFLPFRVARNAKQFTSYPHLTMALHPVWAAAAVTVPNGVRGGIRKKLAGLGLDGFMELMAQLEKRLRPATKSPGVKPLLYATQRHYKSQRSSAEMDARIDADLRTAVSGVQAGVKHQPQWIEAIYEVLVHKRSNVQWGIEIRFDYDYPPVRSAGAVDLFADSWKALSPLISFLLEDSCS